VPVHLDSVPDKPLAYTLVQLESSLWEPTTRGDATYMDSILANDFTEVGRSGRTYTRAQALTATPESVPDQVTLTELAVRPIRPNLALVTCVSSEGPDNSLRARRTSLWRRGARSWHLLFHQGAPTA